MPYVSEARIRERVKKTHTLNMSPLFSLMGTVPGLIKTPGHLPVAKEVDDMLMAGQPMHRWGSPQECVDGIIYLCSELSSFATGSTLEVDGGAAAKSR
jgi:NAD(P)-dependent dehydrogenase (short-subunit alcohol dehydrogenase family)